MDDLELIKQKINIVDLIGEHLTLKKAGVNFKANCPFHQEKTPSFMVSPERGIWHCFGCQKGGDIFKFLMEKEGIEFVEALDILAKRAGITLKKRRAEEGDRKSRLVDINLKAAQFFHHLLTKHPLGEKAHNYLKKRGVTEETTESFNLGYAPNSWSSLINFLLKRNFTTQEAVTAGLIIPSGKSGYDRFRGRITFPLVNVKDQIIGFAGRVLDGSEPKYLNTPQTLLFDKSNFLFGLNLAKSTIKIKNQAILVEGEMDMILSFQAGVKNVVACKGTGLTLGQVELIKRYTDTILLCFDKDLAGDTAARRGIELADRAGLSMKVIQVKEGKDPADLVLKDPKKWEEAIEKAEPIYDYYLRSASLRYNVKEADGSRRLAHELLPIWSKISDHLVREHYIQKLAALLGVSEEIIRKEIEKRETVTAPNYNSLLKKDDSQFKVSSKTRRELLEEYLLSLLLKIPPDLTFIPTFPETLFVSETLRSFYVLLVLYLDRISFKAKAFSISEFAQTLPEDLVTLADQLYLTELDEKLSNSPSWLKEESLVVTELKRSLIKASLEKLSFQIKNAQTFGKIDQLEHLNRRFRDLSLKLKTI